MRRFVGLALFIVVAALLFSRQAISLYADWLWFGEVGYTQIFSTILFYKSLLGLFGAVVFAALFYFNVKFAAATPASLRFSGIDNVIELPPPDMIDPLLKRLLLPITAVLGLMALPHGAANWEPLSLFLNPVDFNLRDPQFDLDIGFYIFRLPALQIVYQSLMFALALTTIATAAVYFVYRGIAYSPRGLFLTDRAKSHLLILLAAMVLVKAGGYYLDAFELLYSPRGVAFGASYADINATLPALRILFFLALLAALLCVVQTFRDGYRYLLLGLGGLVGVHALGLNAYPALLQRFRVAPNEAVAERPFIERNIKATRHAFGSDKIERKEFQA